MLSILKAVALSLLIAIPGLVHATAQTPDKISIDGEEHALNTNPLERYLEARKWKPPEEAVVSSANWRGYIAHWKIRDKQLLLEDVTVRVEGSERGSVATKSIMTDLFSSEPPIVADWYSGALIIPQGKMTRYVHMGYGSTYEHYQIFRISSGKVIEQLSLSEADFERYKARKFEEFTRTDEFKKAYEDLRKDGTDLSHEQLLDFMRSFFAERYLSL